MLDDQKNAAMLDMLRRVTLMVWRGNRIKKAPWFTREPEKNVLKLASYNTEPPNAEEIMPSLEF